MAHKTEQGTRDFYLAYSQMTGNNYDSFWILTDDTGKMMQFSSRLIVILEFLKTGKQPYSLHITETFTEECINKMIEEGKF